MMEKSFICFILTAKQFIELKRYFVPKHIIVYRVNEENTDVLIRKRKGHSDQLSTVTDVKNRIDAFKSVISKFIST